MIQIGKSEDSSNIYISFCIKKELLDNESIEIIDVATKQMLNVIAIMIDDTTKNLRWDSQNTSYYMNKIKNYTNVMDIINSSSTILKESVNTEDEEEVEEKIEEKSVEVT